MTETEDRHVAFSKAWVKALADMPTISKTETADVPTKTGGKYSYTYATLAETLSAVRPVLAKHGLAVSQEVVDVDGRVGVVTLVTHKDGATERFGPLVMAGGGTPQSVGSAISYARRYAITAVFGLATEDDDEAGEESPVPEFRPQVAPTNMHDKAYTHALGTLHKAAVDDVFLDALSEAGVPGGGRITRKEQYETVLEFIDEYHDRVEEDHGSGY